VAVAVDEALRAREEGRSRVVLFNLSGHGHFDMQAYTDFFAGQLQDIPFDRGALEKALAELPVV
jgi:tryptophan synthase beta chain